MPATMHFFSGPGMQDKCSALLQVGCFSDSGSETADDRRYENTGHSPLYTLMQRAGGISLTEDGLDLVPDTPVKHSLVNEELLMLLRQENEHSIEMSVYYRDDGEWASVNIIIPEEFHNGYREIAHSLPVVGTWESKAEKIIVTVPEETSWSELTEEEKRRIAMWFDSLIDCMLADQESDTGFVSPGDYRAGYRISPASCRIGRAELAALYGGSPSSFGGSYSSIRGILQAGRHDAKPGSKAPDLHHAGPAKDLRHKLKRLQITSKRVAAVPPPARVHTGADESDYEPNSELWFRLSALKPLVHRDQWNTLSELDRLEKKYPLETWTAKSHRLAVYLEKKAILYIMQDRESDYSDSFPELLVQQVDDSDREQSYLHNHDTLVRLEAFIRLASACRIRLRPSSQIKLASTWLAFFQKVSKQRRYSFVESFTDELETLIDRVKSKKHPGTSEHLLRYKKRYGHFLPEGLLEKLNIHIIIDLIATRQFYEAQRMLDHMPRTLYTLEQKRSSCQGPGRLGGSVPLQP